MSTEIIAIISTASTNLILALLLLGLLLYGLISWLSLWLGDRMAKTEQGPVQQGSKSIIINGLYLRDCRLCSTFSSCLSCLSCLSMFLLSLKEVRQSSCLFVLIR